MKFKVGDEVVTIVDCYEEGHEHDENYIYAPKGTIATIKSSEGTRYPIFILASPSRGYNVEAHEIDFLQSYLNEIKLKKALGLLDENNEA